VTLEVTPEARTLLGNMGYDPTYGARPLRRVIQKQLVDKLALALLEGGFRAGDTVIADASDGQVSLRLSSLPETAPATA
jgi:ATP-dependent Clp protease ATP-binding subunit ClpB